MMWSMQLSYFDSKMIEIVSNANTGEMINIALFIVLVFIGLWGCITCARIPGILKQYFDYKKFELRNQQQRLKKGKSWRKSPKKHPSRKNSNP